MRLEEIIQKIVKLLCHVLVIEEDKNGRRNLKVENKKGKFYCEFTDKAIELSGAMEIEKGDFGILSVHTYISFDGSSFLSEILDMHRSLIAFRIAEFIRDKLKGILNNIEIYDCLSYLDINGNNKVFTIKMVFTY